MDEQLDGSMGHLPLIMGTAGLALALNVILRRFDMPTLIGYIIAGAVMGTVHELGRSDTHVLAEIAEFGIVFLMFNIGLEFSVRQLIDMRREVLGHGGLQVVATAAIFAALAHWGAGLTVEASLIVGSALAMSSTATVLKILNERHEIGRPHGRQALGILLFQDIAVIPVFLMIQFFAQKDQSLGMMILQTLVAAVVALGALYLLTRYVIRYFLRVISDTRSHELFVAAILLIVVAAAWFTHALGFSWSLGAFFAALMISETKYKYQIEADINPFRDLLLGVFFVTVGMQIDVAFLIAHVGLVLSALLVIMSLKALVIFGILVFSEGRATAFKTAIAIAQGGEFSFAVFELAKNANLLDGSVNQTMILAVVFSIILTPFLLKRLDALGRLAGVVEAPPTLHDGGGGIPSARRNHVVVCGRDFCFQHEIEDGHIVVCGYGPLGREVVRQLQELDLPYVAIEHDPAVVGEAVACGDAVIFGNATQSTILEKAWVATAGAVILAVEDPRTRRMIAEAVSKMVRDPVIVVKVANAEEEAMLAGLPIKGVVHQHVGVAQGLIEQALMCEIPLSFATDLLHGRAAARLAHSPRPMLED